MQLITCHRALNSVSAALIASSLLLTSACRLGDETAPSDAAPPAPTVQSDNMTTLGDFMPPVPVGRYATTRAWDGGDDALIREVANAQGRILIGIKPPNEARSSESGMVPGISRAVFRGGIDMLRARGVNVTKVFQTMPIVRARVDPELAPVLAELPFVNYVEPDLVVHAAVHGRARLKRILQASQDTTWGIANIRAPEAWSFGYRGSGARIWILDSGVDETHATSQDGDWNINNAECSWAVAFFNDCYEDTPGLGHGPLVHTVAVGPDNSVGYIGVANGASGNTMVRVCFSGDPILCLVGSTARYLST